ncbi:MAG: zinc ribbon domain-containing protein [Coriobacteriia bacterium]|nr:zinc ribbon domain-containing protein [Coriobacteriia bacterium]
MPTYELKCDRCGERHERFVPRLLQEDDKVCPACGSTDVRTGVGGGYISALKSGSGSGCAPGGGFT